MNTDETRNKTHNMGTRPNKTHPTDPSAAEIHDFDDIISLPHHVSKKRQPMSMLGRAAQFSPFAALTGYEDAVKETARETEARVELDDEAKEMLDRKLELIRSVLSEEPEVVFTCFVPDERKSGGKYEDISGAVRKIDSYQRIVVMADGTTIPVDNIVQIRSGLFDAYDND